MYDLYDKMKIVKIKHILKFMIKICKKNDPARIFYKFESLRMFYFIIVIKLYFAYYIIIYFAFF